MKQTAMRGSSQVCRGTKETDMCVREIQWWTLEQRFEMDLDFLSRRRRTVSDVLQVRNKLEVNVPRT
jgi:hypothetical protein